MVLLVFDIVLLLRHVGVDRFPLIELGAIVLVPGVGYGPGQAITMWCGYESRFNYSILLCFWICLCFCVWFCLFCVFDRSIKILHFLRHAEIMFVLELLTCSGCGWWSLI